ncbi:MAG: hypothetical protein JSW51_14100 [Gemmatimonadota bacterium]|nr:MAG: hypothetical protein JSW51_14100 [Gemmatimonadota bacterium]
MHRFLFTTLPSNDLGLLARSLPIARELAELGHEIAFCSPGKAPSVLIAEAGFPNLVPRHPLYHVSRRHLGVKGAYRLLKERPLKDEYGFFSFIWTLIRAAPVRFAPLTAEVWNTDHAFAMAGMKNANFVRANCGAMMDLIADFAADVVVDFWNPFACIAARAAGKPLVTVIQADAHPSNNGFIWWKDKPDGLPTALPAINKVLSGYGLQPLSKTEELNVGDLTLILGAPETDPVPDTTGCAYIGPVLWQNPEIAVPQWLEELDHSKPIVWAYSGNPRYASKGTALDSEVVLRACIEVLAELDVQVVLTTGHHALPDEFAPLPGNFRFASYVPGLTMAEKCDLMIHHGGYGSCQTGLYAATPAVIIPTFSERESNARRIAALGAGEFVLPQTDDAGRKHIDLKEFRTKVKRVLSDSAYVENARRCSELFRSYGGARQAAQMIEGVAKGSAIGPTS